MRQETYNSANSSPFKDENKYELKRKTQSVPHSKHTPSRL